MPEPDRSTAPFRRRCNGVTSTGERRPQAGNYAIAVIEKQTEATLRKMMVKGDSFAV
jgi:hypothetical protein